MADHRNMRAAKVKNKNPAPLQITAEQILREASERQEAPLSVPKQKITDLEELNDYRQVKRRGFEDGIRKNRNHVGTWVKYAAWEESQGELERARSIFERSIDTDYHNQVLWIKYAEMEMKHRNVNMARNIFDRAVAILPRVDAFWYKYTYMEETLENVSGARQVFERWMEWEPPEEAWLAYIKLEKRYREFGRARMVFKRMVETHPQPKNWLKWAKFEESIGNAEFGRQIYESCIQTLGEEYVDQNVYISFAKFETRLKELDRARAIYRYAISKLPRERANNLHNVYSQFEKQHGGQEGIEDVIVQKRRIRYEEEVASNPNDYDTWFDYTRLEEDAGEHERIREVYERGIAQVPMIMEKRYWRRYVYLWLFYAVWEENVAKEFDRAREVYKKALALVPHKSFTFAKLWLNYAKFLIRRGELDQCRKTLGMSIGLCPKERLFRGYIELEIQLREFDRVRTLYEKNLEWAPSSCPTWIKYAELERSLGDIDRCRGIFEIAVARPELDMPEVLWKGYIDFETGEDEWGNARALYERLLEKTDHVKVWIAFANFEIAADDLPDAASATARLDRARAIFRRAADHFRRHGKKQERVVLIEAWLAVEKSSGDKESIARVEALKPRAVKKRRRVVDEHGVEGDAWEEYFDFLFPDDETEKPSIKLLELAHKWKAGGAAALLDDDDDDDEDDDDEDDDEEDGGEDEEEGVGKRKWKGKEPEHATDLHKKARSGGILKAEDDE